MHLLLYFVYGSMLHFTEEKNINVHHRDMNAASRDCVLCSGGYELDPCTFMSVQL